MAFFVANFGYTKAEYEALTLTEKAFIYKAWETKLVTETQLINNAVANAIQNTNRKRGKRWLPLWRKKPKKVETDYYKDIVAKMQKSEDRSWYDKIMKGNKKRG